MTRRLNEAQLEQRARLEDPARLGIDTGALEVEQLARYDVTLADLSNASATFAESQHFWRISVGAVVAQRSMFQLIGARPWRLHFIENNGTGSLALQIPAAPYAPAGGAPSVQDGCSTRAWAGSALAGAQAVAGNVGGFVTPATRFNFQPGFFVPGGVPLSILSVNDNLAVAMYLHFSQVPEPR